MQILQRLCLVLGVSFLASSALSQTSYQLLKKKILVSPSGAKKIVFESEEFSEAEVPLQQISYPAKIIEHEPITGESIVELRGTDKSSIDAWLNQNEVESLDTANFLNATDEVRTLIQSGPSNNRIDLVFMGDGYTEEQKELFFSDMKRLVDDMFVGKTFRSYLPVFNVYAVFRASQESGIGNGSSKNTAYGLYREKDTLRAIYPGNTAAIHNSCSKAPGCDYPIVIANDPNYGGLGGEVAISTSSPTSGTVVLRHELGHNFGNVGEEYDGGGYFGANYSSSLNNLKWKHWLKQTPARQEPMAARHVSWPWQNLADGPFTVNLSSNGNYAKTLIRISASGIETPDTLDVKLDGANLEFPSPNRLDRSFFDIVLPQGLTKGSHSLSFSEHVKDGNNWLSNLTVHEYAADFNQDPSFVGAFPVFSSSLKVSGYRATNESCLMRNMLHEYFCPVCQENNWLKFFANVKPIDQVEAKSINGRIQASVKTLNLGQFRSTPIEGLNDTVDIQWLLNGTAAADLAGQTTIDIDAARVTSRLEVRVIYKTPEVRADSGNLLKQTKVVTIQDF